MIATLASQKNTGPKPAPKFWIWVTSAYTATTLLFFLKSKSYQNENPANLVNCWYPVSSTGTQFRSLDSCTQIGDETGIKRLN
jgi:hypothetical protein